MKEKKGAKGMASGHGYVKEAAAGASVLVGEGL